MKLTAKTDEERDLLALVEQAGDEAMRANVAALPDDDGRTIAAALSHVRKKARARMAGRLGGVWVPDHTVLDWLAEYWAGPPPAKTAPAKKPAAKKAPAKKPAANKEPAPKPAPDAGGLSLCLFVADEKREGSR